MSTHLTSSDEPPAKRRKLHTDVQRCPDFWFKKGDFVLVAGQKMAYRLHGDVLGRRSKVFRDLLDLDEVPRPDAEDTMDGCPIVHITDSPEDFSTFLGLVYDGFESCRQHAQKPRWATVRVMVLLGDKYDVPEMREEGLKQLRGWYAEDIDAWDKRDETFFARRTDYLSAASVTGMLGEPKLHAAALYQCCSLPSSQLVRGDPKIGCPPLCEDDLVRTLDYIRWMPQALITVICKFFTRLHEELLACAECRGSRRDVQAAIDNDMKANPEYYGYLVLEPAVWEHLLSTVKGLVCETCFLHYTSEIRLLRQKLRVRLVTLF